jgi:hypothetical protein
LLDTSLGSWGKVYFIKTSPYLKQIFNWAIFSNSFGRETQRFLHKLVGYKSVRGWEYQIQNALAIQTHFFFQKMLQSLKMKNRFPFSN